jgi:hypothetical protein
VKLLDCPAAVTGNICFFYNGHCENGKVEKSRFNAESQKTKQVRLKLKSSILAYGLIPPMFNDSNGIIKI